MCCTGIVKTVKTVGQITRGYLYLAGGVNDELSKERMKICYNCPRFVGGVSCQICGCEMDAKTRLPEVSCPDVNPKWHAVAI